MELFYCDGILNKRILKICDAYAYFNWGIFGREFFYCFTSLSHTTAKSTWNVLAKWHHLMQILYLADSIRIIYSLISYIHISMINTLFYGNLIPCKNYFLHFFSLLEKFIDKILSKFYNIEILLYSLVSYFLITINSYFYFLVNNIPHIKLRNNIKINKLVFMIIYIFINIYGIHRSVTSIKLSK